MKSLSAFDVNHLPQRVIPCVVQRYRDEAARADRCFNTNQSAGDDADVGGEELLPLASRVGERELDRPRWTNDALDGLVGPAMERRSRCEVARHSKPRLAASSRHHDDVRGDRVLNLDAATDRNHPLVIHRGTPVLIGDLTGTGALNNGHADQIIEHTAAQRCADRVGTERHRGRQRAPGLKPMHPGHLSDADRR